jgi:hypothetical protein
LAQANNLLYTTISDGVTSIKLHHNTSGAAGGVGQYVIVTFTAAATSQAFTMTGGTDTGTGTPGVTSLVMAYQLRLI